MEIQRNANTRKSASNLLRKFTAAELSKFTGTNSIKQISTIYDKVQRNTNRRIYHADEPFVINNGGLGDVLFGIAASFANNHCKLIHAANYGMKSTIEKFIEAFGIPYDVKENPYTTEEFDQVSKSKWCKSIGHLPLHLDYRLWSKSENFENIPRQIPVFDLFGKHPNLIKNTKGMVVICPRGSNSPSFVDSPDGKRFVKSREISQKEYQKLTKKFLRKNTVIVIGSEKDLAQYGMIDHSHFFWMTFDKLINYKNVETIIDIKTALSIVNACKLVISVDTWLKTYAGIAELPTIVLKTRFNDGYLDKSFDVSENIFLNKKMWDFRISKIEDLI